MARPAGQLAWLDQKNSSHSSQPKKIMAPIMISATKPMIADITPSPHSYMSGILTPEG